jgi:ABC-type lipoprotein release transport system permease subunit
VRAARSLVVDVSPADPLTYAAVVLVFVATAAAASLAPVRRALAVDPIVALRAE